MSLSVHIVRRGADGQETPITLDEWNVYIESDPELKRPEPGHLNYNQTLALLPSETASADDWQWLAWSTGSIFSDYPQQPMLKKIGQIARYFDAVVMSDEGDIWSIDEEGRVLADPPSWNISEASPQPARKPQASRPGYVWPYFNYDSETDPRGIIIWLLGWRADVKLDLAERCVAEGLGIPFHEAAAAIRACQSRIPIGLPAPENFEEICALSEQIESWGLMVTANGVRVPPWK